MKKDLLIYVFNVVEDEWSFISAISNAIKRYEYITEAEDATDAYFMALSAEKDFIYVTPKAISPLFQDYCRNIFGYKQATIIQPQLKSHLICEDLAADSAAFEKLTSLCRGYERIVLTSYAATPQLYSLKEQLEHLGFTVYTPEAPEFESSWTVNFYGSKSGIRQLAQQSVAQEPDFIMPDGVICVGRDDAASIAANRYIKNQGVAIKTNKGSGGSGVLLYRPGELPDTYRACKQAILKHMEEDRYWDMFPTVIEDLININYSVAGGFPNVEFKIHKNGRIEMLYVCACQVTKKGKFYGVDINEDILGDRVQTKLEDMGYYIAEKYASAGYRGHFDLDMIAAKNGKVYVCESNTRNTGGTDTYKIAKALLGKDFMDDGYTLSRSHAGWLTPHSHTLNEVLEVSREYAYDRKKRLGVIFNSENSIPDGKLIYTILAPTKKAAYGLEQELFSLWKRYLQVSAEFDTYA